MIDIIKFLKREKGISFNAQQQEAVVHTSPNILLLAVPGSGKTTVLVARIAHMMLNEGIPSQNILTLTFSKASAVDMNNRFEKLFKEIISNIPRFSTIHSFCYSVLRKYASVFNRELPLNIETADVSINKAGLIRQINNRINNEFIGDDQLENLVSEISFVKNMLYNEEQILQRENGFENFHQVFSEYEQIKKDKNYIDFDDMLQVAYKILTQYPSICEGYVRQYPYINIDEAQDTSKVQHEIVKKLSETGKSLFMVGDEDQSIYSFRGAFPQGLLNFDKEYRDSCVLKMEENFRSPSDIVEKANAFIKYNQFRYDKNMISNARGEENVHIFCLHDFYMQYEHIASVLSKIPEKETTAIIYRNNESGIPFIDMFERKNIPYRLKENKGYFFDSFVVKDIECFFKLAFCPDDTEAFKQVYYKMHFSKMMLEYVEKNIHRYATVFDALLSINSLPDYRRTKIKMLKRDFEKLAQLNSFNGIVYIEKYIEYKKYLEGRGDSGFSVEVLQQKLNILKTVSKSYPNVFDFLNRMRSLKQRMTTSVQNREAGAIVLSTVHSCKGLEFDNVILIDLADGQFPSKDAIKEMQEGNRQGIEEEVRLFYVGITRAKKNLYIYTADEINGVKASRSRFISMLTERDKERAMPVQNRKNVLKDKKINAYQYQDMTVDHRFFGNGVIREVVDEEQVKIEFDQFGTKEISLSYCLDNRIIKILKQEDVHRYGNN